MKSKLIQAKTILVKYIEHVEYDVDAIEYLIDTIDYLLNEKIPCNKEIISIFMEDVMTAGMFHKSKDLLEVVALLNEVYNMVEV